MDPTIGVDVHDRRSRSKVRPSDSWVLFQCYSYNAITCKTTYSCCCICKTNCSRTTIAARRNFLSCFLDALMIGCSGSDHDRAQEKVSELPHGSFGLPRAFPMLLHSSRRTLRVSEHRCLVALKERKQGQSIKFVTIFSSSGEGS